MNEHLIIRFTFVEKEYARIARSIRTSVFVEEQGVPAELEYDEFDNTANHYLLLINGLPIATARWRLTGKGVKLERFAMLPEFRSKGLGRLILEAVMKDVKPLKKPIYLHSQDKAVSFYQRYGFKKSGEPFSEAGITHYIMHWD